jgi:hypothetical protein
LPGVLAKGWRDCYSNIELCVTLCALAPLQFKTTLSALIFRSFSWLQRTYHDLMLPPAEKLLPDQVMPMPVLVVGLEVPRRRIS